MKIVMYLAFLVPFYSCPETTLSDRQGLCSAGKPSTAGTFPGVSPPSVRELKSVEDIKKEYAMIASKVESGSLDTTSFQYDCNGEKGGRVVYFSDQGQLRMIRHTYHEYSHFSATDEYFLKEDAPFFVFYKHSVWSFVDEEQTKDVVTEKRLYIIDRSPILCLQKKFTLLSSEKKTFQPAMVPNQTLACPSLQPIHEKVALFLHGRKQKEDLACLGD